MIDIRKKIYDKLLLLGKDIKSKHISELQGHKYSEKRFIRADLLDFDYSKQRINDEVIDYLLEIPNLINLKDSLDKLLRGDVYNPSEGRAVTHTLYRDKT